MEVMDEEPEQVTTAGDSVAARDAFRDAAVGIADETGDEAPKAPAAPFVFAGYNRLPEDERFEFRRRLFALTSGELRTVLRQAVEKGWLKGKHEMEVAIGVVAPFRWPPPKTSCMKCCLLILRRVGREDDFAEMYCLVLRGGNESDAGMARRYAG